MEYAKNFVVEYGNESLSKDTFSEVDCVVFNMLSLIDTMNIIPKMGINKKISFSEAIQKHMKLHNSKKMGLLLRPHLFNLLVLASKQKRYKNLKLHNLFYNVSKQEETQSIFFTIDFDDETSLIIYGGTDDTIIGWKEDFNMMYIKQTPCLKNGLFYLNYISENIPQKIIITGHSKGGHIATYCSLFTNKKVQDKIIRCVSFDGPGYPIEIATKEIDEQTKAKCISILPNKSVVGRMFHPLLPATIVKSTATGLDAHDPTSWVVEGKSFVRCQHFTQRSNDAVESMNKIVANTNPKDAKKFVDSLFSVLFVNNNHSLTDVSKNSILAIRQFFRLDKEDKKMINHMVKTIMDDGLIIRQLFPHLSKLFKRKNKNEK